MCVTLGVVHLCMCTRMHMYVEVRDQHWMPFIAFQLPLRTGFLTALAAHQTSWLANKPQGSASFHRPSAKIVDRYPWCLNF